MRTSRRLASSSFSPLTATLHAHKAWKKLTPRGVAILQGRREKMHTRFASIPPRSNGGLDFAEPRTKPSRSLKDPLR